MLLKPSDYMFTELNGSANPSNCRAYPYGLSLLGAYIKQKLAFKKEIFPVDGMLCSLSSTEWLEDIVKREKPDVVIAVVNVLTVHLWINRVSQLKSNYPFKFIGLIHLPFEKDCLERYSVFDVIIFREWLQSSINVLNALEAKESLKKVKGIHIQENGIGFYTGQREHLRLSDYPLPDYDLFATKSYAVFPTEWTTGCNYNCAYCYFGIYPESGWESKKIERIVQEVADISKLGLKEITLSVMDNEFTLNPSFAVELLEKLAKLKVSLNIHANTRVNRITKKLLQVSKKAGISTFGVGIESGVQRVLDANNKQVTLDQIRGAIKLIQKSKIFLQAYIQVGLLDENEDDFKETIRFTVDHLNLQRVELGVCVPYPGTFMERELIKRGWLKGSLKINNLIWLYKNAYKYPFLQVEDESEEPYWRVSDRLDLPRVIELFREYYGKMPQMPYHTPIGVRIQRRLKRILV